MQISLAFCPSCGESLRNDRQTSTDRGSTCAENVMIETLRKSNSPRKRASSSGMDPSVPNLKNIFMSKWHLIENQPLLREIYREPPFISYRKGKSLKDILVRAKL